MWCPKLVLLSLLFFFYGSCAARALVFQNPESSLLAIPPHRCVFARAFLFSFWAITITNSVIIIAILIVIIIVTAHEGASVFARILEQAVVQAMYSMGWGADGHPYFLEVGLVDDWPVIYQTQVLK